MSCDMPGPWDAECAVLYVNMQWQSCGNRVAIVWQSCGNRVAIEQYRRWALYVTSPAESETTRKVVGVMSRRTCARTLARDLQHLLSAQIPTRWQERLRELQGAESDHHAFVPHLHVRCSPSPSTQIVIYSELHLPPSSMCPPFASPLFEIHDRSADQTRRQSEGSPPQASKILISCLLLTCRPSLLLVSHASVYNRPYGVVQHIELRTSLGITNGLMPASFLATSAILVLNPLGSLSSRTSNLRFRG